MIQSPCPTSQKIRKTTTATTADKNKNKLCREKVLRVEEEEEEEQGGGGRGGGGGEEEEEEEEGGRRRRRRKEGEGGGRRKGRGRGEDI